MRLCDSSMTTASQLHVVEVVAVRVALERVDRDDDPLVEGERVAARRDLPLDPLDADRVQPDQRDREPGPQLLLELLEDLLRGHYQDPVAPAAADQLGEDQPDLQRLAQSHHVREQDAGPQPFQGELGRALLEGQRVEQEPVRQRQAALGLGQRGTAQGGFQEQPGHGEPRCLVRDENGLLGFEQERLRVLQLGEEHRVLVPDQFRDAGRADLVPVVLGDGAVADHPLRLADHDTGAGRVRGAAGLGHSAAPRAYWWRRSSATWRTRSAGHVGSPGSRLEFGLGTGGAGGGSVSRSRYVSRANSD